jgi:hypothetical protein
MEITQNVVVVLDHSKRVSRQNAGAPFQGADVVNGRGVLSDSVNERSWLGEAWSRDPLALPLRWTNQVAWFKIRADTRRSSGVCKV